MELLDANVIIRYLTNDPPEMGERAAALIEGSTSLAVSPLILAEAGFVLTKFYGRDRRAVVNALSDFVLRDNITVFHLDVELVVEALELCAPSNRISFADALLWAEARMANGAVHTFDQRFPDRDIAVRLL